MDLGPHASAEGVPGGWAPEPFQCPNQVESDLIPMYMCLPGVDSN